MNYLGDFAPGSMVYVWFNTFSSNDPSASVTATDLVDTDIVIYKDDSLTQRATTEGMTIDVDVDTFAGVHKFSIDTADNTVGDFWEAGHDYAAVAVGITVDSGSINAVVATFSIANRRTAGQMCQSSIEGLTDQHTFTLTSGEASADDDAYNDCIIIVTDQTTKIQKAVGYISDYTGNTRSVQLYAAPLQTNFTMAVADSVEIFATSAFSNVYTVNRTAQTAGDLADAVITDAAGTNIAADIIAIKSETATIVTDTNEIQGKLPTNKFMGSSDGADDDGNINSILTDTGTTLQGELDGIQTDTEDIQSRIPAALSSGNIKADVLAISTSTDAADKQEAAAEMLITGAAEAGTLSTIQATTDLTEATNDHYNGRVVIYTSGVLLGQASDITDYNGADGMLTYPAMTEAPSANDTFVIV